MYLNVEVSKYTLPEEIKTNIKNVTAQNFNNMNEKDVFDFGQENILDRDNSMNSFVGCCSLGTGQLDRFINIFYGKFKLSPLFQKDSRS